MPTLARKPRPWVGNVNRLGNQLGTGRHATGRQRAPPGGAFGVYDIMRLGEGELSFPPPQGLHVQMGASGAEKIGNLVENVAAGRIAPVEIIARK